MIKYKLTTQNLTTHKDFQWEVGIPKTIENPSEELCSEGVFHYYASPEQAALFNPIHANIKNPRLFEVEIDREVAFDGLKGGCHQMTLIKEIPLPQFTLEQRIKFAIKCALLVYKEESFVQWAVSWLSGKDRTAYVAYVAARAAADAAAFAAAYAAAYAAADAAARAAADAAADAAARAASINFQEIIEEVIND